jgi:hypothetical protein
MKSDSKRGFAPLAVFSGARWRNFLERQAIVRNDFAARLEVLRQQRAWRRPTA